MARVRIDRIIALSAFVMPVLLAVVFLTAQGLHGSTYLQHWLAGIGQRQEKPAHGTAAVKQHDPLNAPASRVSHRAPNPASAPSQALGHAMPKANLVKMPHNPETLRADSNASVNGQSGFGGQATHKTNRRGLSAVLLLLLASSRH